MRFIAAFFVLLASVGFAEDADVARFRELLRGGYYHSAAQLNGPELIRALPEHAEARFLYAQALFYAGDVDLADEQLDIAMELNNGTSGPYLALRGEIRAQQGRLAEALDELREAYQLDPSYEIAMTLGTVAWQLAEFDVALEAFGAAADTVRGRRELWPYLAAGRVQLAQGELAAALELFTRAIDVFEEYDTGSSGLPSPGYVEAFYRLGQTYERLGNFTQAEVQYRAARSSDPNYAPAIDGLDRLSRRFE